MTKRILPSVAVRRAQLVAQCANEILGAAGTQESPVLRLDLSVNQFQGEFVQRFAHSHPELVVRSDSTIERARLFRTAAMAEIPRVMLRRGTPVRRRQFS